MGGVGVAVGVAVAAVGVVGVVVGVVGVVGVAGVLSVCDCNPPTKSEDPILAAAPQFFKTPLNNWTKGQFVFQRWLYSLQTKRCQLFCASCGISTLSPLETVIG